MATAAGRRRVAAAVGEMVVSTSQLSLAGAVWLWISGDHKRREGRLPNNCNVEVSDVTNLAQAQASSLSVNPSTPVPGQSSAPFGNERHLTMTGSAWDVPLPVTTPRCPQEDGRPHDADGSW